MRQTAAMKVYVICMTLAIVMIFAGQATAAQFTAVVFTIHPQGELYPLDTLMPNLWVNGNMYRYEGDFQDRQIIIISNKDTDSTWLLDKATKTYTPAKRSDAIIPDPVYLWDNYSTELKEEPQGTEMVGGYPCQKSNFMADHGLWLERWASDSLGYSLKFIMHYPRDVVVTVMFVNIKEMSVGKEWFELPANYVDYRTLPKEERPDFSRGTGKR